MSFEVSLVGGAASPEPLSHEATGKERAKGAEGHFQALMAMAMSALFGGVKAAEVTAAAAGQEEPTASQSAVSEIPMQAEDSPVFVESRSVGTAPVAGPVKVAEGASEAGNLLAASRGVMQIPAAEVEAGAPLAKYEASLMPSATVSVGSGAEGTILFSVKETADVAEAPTLQFQLYGDDERMPVAGRNGSAPPREQTKDVTAAPAAGRSAAQDKPASPVQDRDRFGLPPARSGAEAQDLPEDDGPRVAVTHSEFEPTPAEIGPTEILVDQRPVENPSIVDMATVKEVDAVGTPSQTRSLRQARAIAEELAQESLKRLPRNVELRLDPPAIGSVTALLSQRGQEVTVKFVAHTAEAQQALSDATGDLVRSLGEKGLVLTGFSVDAGYSDQRGQEERRENAARPATLRYGRASRVSMAPRVMEVGLAAGSFNWLA